MPSIQHTLVLCPKPEARLAVLRQFLKGVKAATVVFFDEKRLSLLPKIAAALKRDDLRVDVLNESDDLESRSSAFEAFVRGEVDVLLTTDLAARGLDAPRTALVVNFDVPRTATDYSLASPLDVDEDESFTINQLKRGSSDAPFERFSETVRQYVALFLSSTFLIAFMAFGMVMNGKGGDLRNV